MPSPWTTPKRWPFGSQAKACAASFIFRLSMGTSASSTRNNSKEWNNVFRDFVCVITLIHRYLPCGCQNNLISEFYAGSLTGENHPAADKGQLLYGLAQSRADNFGTTTNDVANANTVALATANAGRNALQQAKCADVPAQLVILTQQMTVPLVQGTLKYAWEADPAQTGSACAGQTAPFDAGCSKAWAEGWTFASAILPQLDACDAAAAKTVKDALDGAATAPMVGGLAAVKSAIEGCYTKMGITCDEVGEYQKSGVVFNGMCKCAGSVASKCPAESDAAAAP